MGNDNLQKGIYFSNYILANTITITTDHLYSLNKYINAERRHKFAAARMKKTAQTITIEKLEEANAHKKLLFNIASSSLLVFDWHLHSRRKDPDNISSMGRKVILDAMQECGVAGISNMLPNDSLEFLIGFVDLFTLVDNSKLDNNKTLKEEPIDSVVITQFIPKTA